VPLGELRVDDRASIPTSSSVTLTQDDPIQSLKATEILERRLTEENPGFVSIVAIVETVGVLDRAYSLAAHEIAAAVEGMLQADVLVVENEPAGFHGHDRT